MEHFTVESIQFVQLCGLMITSAHEEVVGVADFPGEKAHYNLTWKAPTIDKITIEKVWVLFGWNTIKLKDIQ